MSGMDKVLKKHLTKDHLICALQKGIDALNEGGPTAQSFNGELEGYFPAVEGGLGGANIFAHSGWDSTAYPYSAFTLGAVLNPSCSGNIGTLVINPNIPAGNNITTADFSFEIINNSAGLGGIRPFCITDGRLLGPQQTVPSGGLGTNTGPSSHTVTFTLTDTTCPSEDIRFAYTAWGQTSAVEPPNCDEINPNVETLVTVTPSKRDAVRECFKQLFCDFYPEELSDLDAEEVQSIVQQYLADNPQGMSEEQFKAGILACFAGENAPEISHPEQRICTGPFERCTNRTGWWAPSWSPVYTEGAIGTVEDDWVPVGNPVVSPDCVTDLTFDADLGNHLMYLRNIRAYYWVDYRLMVNGAAVLTRTYDKYWYVDERIKTAEATTAEPLQYIAIPISNAVDHRLNIPAGATVGVEARRRYRTVAAQDANYFRVISGLRSQTTFSFTPRELVIGREEGK